MKVEKLICKNQPSDWYQKMVKWCNNGYPIKFIDIKSNEPVIDAGCNVGGFSKAFENKFNNILAIDASSYNVEQYRQNLPNNKVLHKAVYSQDNEVLRLKKYMAGEYNDTVSGNFSTFKWYDKNNNHGWVGGEYEEVETISLETILEMVGGSIGLLKIDVEGAEADFLYNKNLSKIKYIMGEFHYFLGKEKLNQLFSWINKTHSEIYSKGGSKISHFIKIWRLK